MLRVVEKKLEKGNQQLYVSAILAENVNF